MVLEQGRTQYNNHTGRMAVVGINIGSNAGNRGANLRYAVSEIERRLGCRARRSSVYVTEPWGYLSDSPFFNIELEITTDVPGRQLLVLFRDIEHGVGCYAHRDSEGHYVDRTLDIDIVYIGDEVSDDAELTLPHPRMQDRDFVLLPLAELSPGWRHPVTGKTVGELLADLRRRKGQLNIKKTKI